MFQFLENMPNMIQSLMSLDNELSVASFVTVIVDLIEEFLVDLIYTSYDRCLIKALIWSCISVVH